MYSVVDIIGVSPGSTIGLDLKTPLYVGGVDPRMRLPTDLGVVRGFYGCVAEVSLLYTSLS